MKNQNIIEKVLLYIGVFNTIYFSFLIYSSYHPPKGTTAIHIMRFFGELLTIPFLLIILFSWFFSIFKLFQKGQTRKIIIIFCINLMLILGLLCETIHELT